MEFQQQLNDFVLLFMSIIWEAFPFVVLGAFIAGFLEEMVPQQAITKIMPKNALLAIVMGGLLGFLFPMCECGIVPVMRRLLRKGLPLGTCIAYMLAGPIVNVIVILSTYTAFKYHGVGWEMVGMRVGMGFVVAVVTAFVVERVAKKHGLAALLTPLSMPPKNVGLEMTGHDAHPAENRAGTKRPFLVRMANISETALHDFVDIMVFLTMGALLSACFRTFYSQDDIKALADTWPAVAILAMMGMAILMCLCSEADAFVAASFTTLPAAMKLSFLVLGPMFDLKLLLMFTRVFRGRLILTIAICVIVQVFAYSMLVFYFVPESFFVKPPELK